MASDKHIFLHKSGKYYHRQWIPSDLREHFSNRPDIAKSLKTTDRKQALSLAAGLHHKYSTAFTLLRSGLLSPDLIQTIVSDTMPSQRHKGNESAPSTSPLPDTQTEPPSIVLSSLIDLFTREHSPKWTEKSQQEFAGQFRLLMMILADKPIASYDRASCLDCRETLLKIPPGFTKKKDLKALPLSGLLALSLPGLTPKTVNKHMVLLSSLFKWAVTHGHMERNPAQGLTMEIRKRADEERKAYDRGDIERILRHLPIDDPVKWWIPRIAMYSGMRLEEICQLTPGDIKHVDGVLCFDVNDSAGRHLKTKSSVRIIPVHPALVDLGFMEYVKGKPSAGNLWGLSRGKWGYGKRFTNWWSTCFNRQYVTDDPLKCFHSFRHGVADTLKQLGVNEALIAELMGHANGSITTGRYGKRYRAAVLLEAVKRVDYGGLILECL